jgi:hypothetical protein
MKSTIPQATKPTPQEKAKDCQTMIDKTIARLGEQLEHGYSEGMKQYLKAMSYFHGYSINNLFLILAQMPQATHVAGFRTWQKLNRTIKKGEKGIRIFAPVMLKKNTDKDGKEENRDNKKFEDNEFIRYYRTVCVFDQSQTEGSPLPKPSTSHGDASQYIPKIEQAIRDAGIQLEYADTGKAFGISCKGRILIKPGMSSAETFSTLVHEYAHELLHQTGKPKDSKTIRELEADAVACVVSEHFGIQTMQASADYIMMWNGDKKLLLERMKRIRDCASTIINKI